MLDRLADFVTEKIGMKFPTVPTKVEDTYLVDSTQTVERPKDWLWPTQTNDQVLDTLTARLKVSDEYPKPGQEYMGYSWDDKDFLFGKKLTRGAHNDIFIDQDKNQVTHLWRFTHDEKQLAQNKHQMEVYRDNAGKSSQFSFTREIPGGWIEPEIKHQGNLKEYLDRGGKLTLSQVEKAIANLAEMQKLTGEAHGDIVKNPTFIPDFNRDLMYKAFEAVKPYGYLNFQNILISPEGELILHDYAGNADPLATGGWQEPARHDVHHESFMSNELKFFEEGLKSLLTNEFV